MTSRTARHEWLMEAQLPRKPTPPEEQKLSPLNLRTTAERRRRLEESAAASGRSLAQEVERLLDYAMDMEQQLGGPGLMDAIRLIAQTAAKVQEETGKGIGDRYTKARVTAAIHAATDWAIPLCSLRLEDEPRAHAIIEIYTVLSMFGSNLDLRSLWLLAEYVPLSDHMHKEFRKVLGDLSKRLPDYHEWSNLVARLDEIQADAKKMHEELALEAEQGVRRAQASFVYALHQSKTGATHFAWSWTRRSQTKVHRTPFDGAESQQKSGD